MEPMDLIVSSVKKLMLSVEIFQKGLSDPYENLDTKIYYERYRRAYLKEDKFESYSSFDPNLLVDWGIVEDIELAKVWGGNPATIPSSLQGSVLINQRNHIIRNYVEPNEYIRLRNGLPPLADFYNGEFDYASEQFYIRYNMGQKPLHLFTDVDFVRLKNSGEYELILKEKPSKKYLKFIGTNKISIFTLKEAGNYDLLAYDNSLDDRLLSDFVKLYEQNRLYLVNVLYVKNFSTRYPYYDSYMAFLLLTMTIQRVIANIFQSGIDRDFYDEINLQSLFESYNMPFIKNMPVEYQKTLARNLNRLLYYKSTDRVLYDIGEILGFNSSEFVRYYIVKQHRLDENGDPVIARKTITNDNNQLESVLDYEAMYDIYFQGVDMNETDVASSLDDTTKRMSYIDMVTDDPYWWDDEDELRKVLYEEEFNIIESKYIGVHSMFRITEMMHEVSRFFRMIIDNKENGREILISLPKIFQDRKLSMYDIIIAAICLICKRNNSKGEIISTPSKTLGVIGFNYKADFDEIREQLEKNRKIIQSDVIAQYILDIEFFTVSDINKVYGQTKALWSFLTERMYKAKTIQEFDAYKKLYKTLIYTQDTTEVYRMKNGEVAGTYLEYLYDLNSELAAKIEIANDTEVLEYLEHIIFSLEDDIQNLKYLNYVLDTGGVMEEAYRQLILFFKSFTIDLKSMSIIYIFDNKYYNMIKLLDQINHIHSHIESASDYDQFKDKFDVTVELLTNQDYQLKDNIDMAATFLFNTLYKFRSKIQAVQSDISVASRLQTQDGLVVGTDVNLTDRIEFSERLALLSSIIVDQFYGLKDKFDARAFIELMIAMRLVDKISIGGYIEHGESIDFRDQNKLVNILISLLSSARFTDRLSMSVNMELDFAMNLISKIDMNARMEHGESIDLRDKNKLMSGLIDLLSSSRFTDRSSMAVKMELDSTLNLISKIDMKAHIEHEESIDLRDQNKLMSGLMDVLSDSKFTDQFTMSGDMQLDVYLKSLNKIKEIVAQMDLDEKHKIKDKISISNLIEYTDRYSFKDDKSLYSHIEVIGKILEKNSNEINGLIDTFSRMQIRHSKDLSGLMESEVMYRYEDKIAMDKRNEVFTNDLKIYDDRLLMGLLDVTSSYSIKDSIHVDYSDMLHKEQLKSLNTMEISTKQELSQYMQFIDLNINEVNYALKEKPVFKDCLVIIREE